MSKSQLLSRAAFAVQIGGSIADLITLLYKRFNGDPVPARAELKRIPDHWKDHDARRAARDQELANLKAQGK